MKKIWSTGKWKVIRFFICGIHLLTLTNYLEIILLNSSPSKCKTAPHVLWPFLIFYELEFHKILTINLFSITNRFDVLLFFFFKVQICIIIGKGGNIKYVGMVVFGLCMTIESCSLKCTFRLLFLF